MSAIARLGDACSHGAMIVTGSGTHMVDGKPLARVGDLVSCPLRGHGVTPIVSVLPFDLSGGQGVAHVAATAACGAVIVTGAPTSFRDATTG